MLQTGRNPGLRLETLVLQPAHQVTQVCLQRLRELRIRGPHRDMHLAGSLPQLYVDVTGVGP